MVSAPESLSTTPKSEPIPAQVKPADIDVEKAQEVIFKPNPGPQTAFLSANEQEVLYGGAAGGGKVVYEYQSVLTSSGYTPIGDLKVGSTIIGSDGKAQKVDHLFAWETLPVWEIELDDGTVFDTAQEHLWSYWMARSGPKKARVGSTQEMLREATRTGNRAIIPASPVVEFTPKSLDVDPYTLGVMLGDGCLTTKNISFTCHGDDWSHFSESVSFLKKDLKRKGITVRVIGDSRKKFVNYLERQNLLGVKSNSKFVPKEFLLNSSQVRKEVLRGLLDTDGYRDKGRARAEYTTVSHQLALDVKFLSQSLGYRVSTYTKVGSYRNELGEKVECQKVYRLYVTGYNVDDLFRLPRKKIGVLGKQLGRRVVDIRKTCRTARGRCISVSNKDGLYITDDFIVTHNSYAMLADPVRSFNNPKFNGLLLRRSTEELRELIQVSKQLYPRAVPGAKWTERDKTWVFPSGCSLWMSYLDRDDDALRYQGQAFTWVGFDELTQWPTPYPWNYLRSRLRSASGLPVYQRGTSNPGGPGHQWVKEMFVDAAPWGESFWAKGEDGNTLVFPKGHSKEGKPLLKRRFIPATLFDNPYLADDGMYEASLLSLPEAERRKLLEGDWDVAEGAAFPEFKRSVHVVDPYDIPRSWTKFRACDYGYGSHTAVLWFAVVPYTDQLVVYRELYVSKITAEDLAEMIKDIEVDDKVRYGVLDSSLWHNRGDTGPSLAEKMITKGCRWRPSDRSKGSRIAGKNELHTRLKVDEFTEEPGIVFFSNCTETIKHIPAIPLDRKNLEDVDTKFAHDHTYDALRYGIMTRPRSNLWDYDPNSQRTGFQASDPTFGY